MRQVLQQLGRIPGVVGSFVCGPKGELLGSEFPPVFDELVLHQSAALFADHTAGLRQLAGPDAVLDLRYARGRALVKPFATGTLFVLGTAAVDGQLLGLALEQASRRLEQEGAAPGSAPAPGRAQPALPSDVAGLRDGLREALLRQIGPVGDLVFEEAWRRWTAATPARSALGGLVQALAREIDDEAGRVAFLAEVRTIAG